MQITKVFLISILIMITIIGYFSADYFLIPNVHTVNRYVSATVRPGFDIRPPFSFLYPKYIRTVEEVVQMKWVHELASILAEKTNKIVYLTASNQGYFVTLLNWLVAVDLNTNIDIKDIIVLSFEKDIYEILKKKEILTIYVNLNELIYHHFILRWTKAYSWDVWMARSAIVRLINHWGYDITVIDLDAIPLKDPIPLLDKYPDSDIVASHSLGKDGFFGVCFGFVLFRSTPRNGMSQ